ncbi:MAG: FtsW/RodA/SpoVE family cell cycle protein [Elusimicrobiota bacterium]
MIKRTEALDHWRRRVDWPLMAAVGALLAIGLVVVLSATSPMGNPARYMIKQLTAVSVGMIGLVLLTSLNYQIFRSHPWILYALTLVALLSVLLVGRRIHGAKSWIVFGPVSVEPVEFARIGFILVLAAILDQPEREMRPLRLLAVVFALAGGHMGLILLEPYLGGILAYVPIVLGMLYFAGMRPLYLLAVIFYGSVAAGIPILSTFFSIQPQLMDSYPLLRFLIASTAGGRKAIELLFITTSAIFALWWFFQKMRFRIPWRYPLFLSLIIPLGIYSAHLAQHSIKDYQRKRIVVFLSPGFDPLGAGYNILQSEIAVGSGRVFGKGLFSGSQTQLGFLPEKHTDFIFSVIGEELGFLWASVVLIAFAVITWRAFVIATETQDRFGSLVAVGLGCLFGFQCVMNIGMTIGLLPVTGVALPLVSYGGSHMVSGLLAIGLLQSVNFRRYIY